MQFLSRFVFAFASFVLMLLALGLIVQGLYYPLVELARPGPQGKIALLGAVGYVIIAIAVFDVAKFLIEEEVLNRREKRRASDARRSLTKFISTIAIAVFLEALVTVFRVSQDNVTELIYPTMLFIAAILLVVGLGIYQRLSAEVEQQVGHKDRAEDAKKPK